MTAAAAPRARFDHRGAASMWGFWGGRVGTPVAGRTADILLTSAASKRHGWIRSIPAAVAGACASPFTIRDESAASTVTTQMFWIPISARRSRRRPIASIAGPTPRSGNRRGHRHVASCSSRGYLSSWYQRIQPGQRWTNLRDCHELYAPAT